MGLETENYIRNIANLNTIRLVVKKMVIETLQRPRHSNVSEVNESQEESNEAIHANDVINLSGDLLQGNNN